MRKGLTLVTLAVLPAALASALAGGGQGRPDTAPAARFILVGDTGTGNERARRVAARIRRTAEQASVSHVFPLGGQRLRARRSPIHREPVSRRLPRRPVARRPDPRGPREPRCGAMLGIRPCGRFRGTGPPTRPRPAARWRPTWRRPSSAIARACATTRSRSRGTVARGLREYRWSRRSCSIPTRSARMRRRSRMERTNPSSAGSAKRSGLREPAGRSW